VNLEQIIKHRDGIYAFFCNSIIFYRNAMLSIHAGRVHLEFEDYKRDEIIPLKYIDEIPIGFNKYTYPELKEKNQNDSGMEEFKDIANWIKKYEWHNRFTKEVELSTHQIFFQQAKLMAACKYSKEEVEIFNELVKFIKEKNQQLQKKAKAENISKLEFVKENKVEVDDTQAFDSLLNQSQKKIIEIDRTYIKSFIQISSFLKIKRERILHIFNNFMKDDLKSDLYNQLSDALMEEKYLYDVIYFNALDMLASLVDDNMIKFYEIYDLFDKQHVFDSEWEKKVSQQLTSIKENTRLTNEVLIQTLKEQRANEQKMLASFGKLIDVTTQGFQFVGDNISKKLTAIDKKLHLGNIIGGINAYQNYKLRKP